MGKEMNNKIMIGVIIITVFSIGFIIYLSLMNTPEVRILLVGSSLVKPFDFEFVSNLTDIDVSAGGFLTPTKYIYTFENEKKIITECCKTYSLGDSLGCERNTDGWLCVSMEMLK